MMMRGNGRITAQAIPVLNLAVNLTGQLGRIVVDKTGLTGKYDITLRWAPDDNRGASPGCGIDRRLRAFDFHGVAGTTGIEVGCDQRANRHDRRRSCGDAFGELICMVLFRWTCRPD